MKISGLRKERRDNEIALVADVKSAHFGENTIWVSVPGEYESWLCTDRCDGFLVALLYPAMEYGEDIEIDGTVSKRLLRNINRFVQDILLAYNSRLHRITVRAAETSSKVLSAATHIGTGFSGGVDSFTTVYDNFAEENDREYKIDTFVCLNVGSHGRYEGKTGDVDTKDMFRSRYGFLKQYPDAVGLPFIPVDSNIHYYHECGHLHTSILTLVAGILTMRGFAKYYVASVGWDYGQWIDNAAKQRGVSPAEFAEPYLLPLMSTESTEFILDGIQYSRVQKTLNIAEYPLTKQFLNVCLINEPQKKNCGICPKCARVGLTLSAVGKLDDYKDVFDVENYKKNEFRLKCEATLNYTFDPFTRDIVDFAKKNGKKYPPYFVAFVHTLAFPTRETVRAIIRKVLGQKFLSKIMRGFVGKVYRKLCKL